MKRLYRSEKDRMICGVCAGVGDYFNVDPTLIRLAFVVLLIFPPVSGLLAYIIAAIVIPTEGRVRYTDTDI